MTSPQLGEFSEVRTTVAECSDMEANLAPDGHVRLVLPHSFKPSITSEFSHLHGCLSTSLYELRHEGDEHPGRNRAAFEERVGIPYEEARAICAELRIIEHDLLGVPRGALNPRTGRHEGRPPEPERTGTEWDRLPRIEAAILPEGGGMALTLGRGELAVFANCVDVAMEEFGAKTSRSGAAEFWICRTMTPEEAEAFRDELRRLDRETRVHRFS
jgi:hypothetical protein